jgi:spore coat protein JA
MNPIKPPVPSQGQVIEWMPFIGPNNPCPPIRVKSYVVPPQVYDHFQPPGLPQFSPHEALRYGTLWPAYYNEYQRKC